MQRDGFTFVELLIIMAVMGILLQLTSVNLLRFQQFATVNSSVEAMVSDIKQQQIKAMSGHTNASGVRSQFGVHFGTDRYTLFTGPVYTQGAAGNLAIPLDSGLAITATSLSNNVLLFQIGSGEVVTADPEETITIRNNSDGATRTIRMNPLGVITALD